MLETMISFALVGVGFVGLFFSRSAIFPAGTVWWLVQKEMYLILLALGTKQLPLSVGTRFSTFVILIAVGIALSWVARRTGIVHDAGFAATTRPLTGPKEADDPV
jgi:ligand-binding SRPBCC domain-containing protein